MQQGTITNLHIARVKGTPSDPVQEATVLSGLGLEGDRSAYEGNLRQVLFMDKETLDEFGLVPGQVKENITISGVDLSQTKMGQVFHIGDEVTMEIVGDCEACGKMEAIALGLKDKIDGRRGMLANDIGGGEIKVMPGVEWRMRAIISETLMPGSWPPSPGLAPWAILISISRQLLRYSAVTPKRPDATCLMALDALSPLGRGR